MFEYTKNDIANVINFFNLLLASSYYKSWLPIEIYTTKLERQFFFANSSLAKITVSSRENIQSLSKSTESVQDIWIIEFQEEQNDYSKKRDLLSDVVSTLKTTEEFLDLEEKAQAFQESWVKVNSFLPASDSYCFKLSADSLQLLALNLQRQLEKAGGGSSY